jgi:hypothetical protein
LGTFGALLLFNIGVGWRAAYINWDDPRELWYVRPVNDDIHELRATLQEMSLRDTGEPHLMAVTAQVPPDGALAWVLRDFSNAVFVDGLGPEIDTAAVLAPRMTPEPNLGADYVGKDLVLRMQWVRLAPVWRDGLMWLYNSDSRDRPVTAETLMVWIRKDVYGVERVTEE